MFKKEKNRKYTEDNSTENDWMTQRTVKLAVNSHMHTKLENSKSKGRVRKNKQNPPNIQNN